MKNNSLQSLRDSVKKRSKKIEVTRAKALRKMEIVCGFDNKNNVTITFEDLKIFKIGERIDVNDSVVFEKVSQTDNKMVFLTFMLDGGSFGVHSHDCYEFCKVLKGNLFDRKQNVLMVYSEGETVVYPPNQSHTPYATMNSTYEVTFIKNI